MKARIPIRLNDKASTTELPIGDGPVTFLDWLDVRKDAILGPLVSPDARGFILGGGRQ